VPRIRSVRPETWDDPIFCSLSAHARLLYIALWGYVDDAGRGRWSPKAIEGYAFPREEVDIEGLLGELLAKGRIIRYHNEENGDTFFCIPTLARHQHPKTPLPSLLPPPPNTKALAVATTKALAPPKVARLPNSPVISVLSAHFGEPTLNRTRALYYKFINQTLMASGFEDDADGAVETERRIINMKAAHHDNTRAWTLTNLMAKWDHWGVDRQPVSAKERDRYLRRQRSQATVQRAIDPKSS